MVSMCRGHIIQLLEALFYHAYSSASPGVLLRAGLLMVSPLAAEAHCEVLDMGISLSWVRAGARGTAQL